MGFSLKMTGDWKRAGITLKDMRVKLYPLFEAQLMEDGEMVLQKLRDHIDAQDLDWTPLSPKTIALKGGDDTIYVDTGALKDGFVVRRVKSSIKGSTFFIGASPWKRHPKGMKMSDLMIWMEYGTDKMVARPLIQPTFDEVQSILKSNWKNCFQKLFN